MYSMNRTSAACTRANSIRSTSFVIVEAAHDHGIELGAGEPDLAEGPDAVEGIGVTVGPREGQRAIGAERVQADGHTMEPGVVQLPGMAPEEQAIGRQGDLIDTIDRHQVTHQFGKVMPQQRLASRQPDLVRAQGGEDPGDPDQFFK